VAREVLLGRVLVLGATQALIRCFHPLHLLVVVGVVLVAQLRLKTAEALVVLGVAVVMMEPVVLGIPLQHLLHKEAMAVVLLEEEAEQVQRELPKLDLYVAPEGLEQHQHFLVRR